jgi:HD-like signal output (HDOD) protein/ActR/RegA family two-component response regulator
MKRRVLFVDDEPRVLEGLGRGLRSLRADWDLLFAESGAMGLEVLAREQVDIVVSDMRMPEMDGLQFLTEVKNRHPLVIRMILSGQADEKLIMRSVGITHQYLSKPCTPEDLISTITRAASLHGILADEKLGLLVSQMESLPSLPALYAEILEELQSPNASITRISEIVSQDPGMTARILQLVNSPFFGIRRSITNPSEAVAYLGIDTIQSLALSVQAFSRFDVGSVPGFSIEQIWQHSLNVAAIARRIFQLERKDKTSANEAFTTGLLHDLGTIVLACNLPRHYALVVAYQTRNGCLRRDAELELLGSSHAEVGAYLLGLWGLPDSIIEAIALHHRPGDCLEKQFDLLCVIHAADALAYEIYPAHSAFKGAALDERYLADAGVIGRLANWRQLGAELPGEGNA